MSMHKKPLTPLEEAGLRAHGLGRDIGKPSQLADVFRQGVAYALAASPALPVPEPQLAASGSVPPLSTVCPKDSPLRAAVGAGAAELPEPVERGWVDNADGKNKRFPSRAVAVDAAPRQNPDSVHQVGAPVGLSDAASPASPWITVSERLPEVCERPYTVVAIAKKVYGNESNYPGEGIRRVVQDWVMRAHKHHFTHWMPLPAPPALAVPEPRMAAPDGVIAGTTEWTKEGTTLPAPPAEAPKEQQP